MKKAIQSTVNCVTDVTLPDGRSKRLAVSNYMFRGWHARAGKLWSKIEQPSAFMVYAYLLLIEDRKTHTYPPDIILLSLKLACPKTLRWKISAFFWRQNSSLWNQATTLINVECPLIRYQDMTHGMPENRCQRNKSTYRQFTLACYFQ